MSGARGRGGHDAGGKKGDGPDGFGNEIERMLMERPMTRQGPALGAAGPGPAAGAGGGGGGGTNTLDELMAELGMLRGERGELSLPADRQLGRNGTRQPGPRMSTGDGSLLGGAADGPLRPGTGAGMQRSSGGSAGALSTPLSGPLSGPLVLPPAKGALPSVSSPGAGPPGPQVPAALGPVRAQSPMSTRRSVTGASPGTGSGALSPAAQPPVVGVLERQAQLEMRLEKMESREQQLMTLINQLQQQVSTLSRAQQATQQQLTSVASTPAPAHPTAPAAAGAAAAAAAGRQAGTGAAAGGGGGGGAAAGPRAHETDEEFIKEDAGSSREGSPKQPRAPQQGKAATAAAAAAAAGPRGNTPPVASSAPTPTPPATGGPPLGPNGRPNKLVPQPGPPADWEADVGQLRKELGALAANVVRVRDQVGSLVPGGPSPLSEEVAAQAVAAAQLKQNLTQIAMDVVSLHKALTSLKQNTDRNFTILEKTIGDMQVQAQTNALNMMTSGPVGMPPHTAGPNAVAAALAASGGVTGSLEESLRSAFAKPAMRQLPVFNAADVPGFMPDNSGVAAAVAAYGGGGGGGRKEAAPANGGGGLNAAWALLSSFEEQAAVEKEEQQKAAAIARQAVSIVDAKVKQVIVHVDRHMQAISTDVEERLRMYESTIIRMAQQVDRVQRVLKELEGAAASRIVVRRGGHEVDPEADEAARRAAEAEEAARREAEEAAAKAAAKENWVKVAAMATGRFVPQKEEKKEVSKPAHGYFQTPK